MTINWKRLTFILMALSAITFGNSCYAKPVFESKPIAQVESGKDYYQLTFQILSISCPACAYGMETEMSKLPGVKYAKIELVQPNGALSAVIYDGNVTKQSAIIDIVHEFHYSEAELKQVPFVPASTIKHDAPSQKN